MTRERYKCDVGGVYLGAYTFHGAVNVPFDADLYVVPGNPPGIYYALADGVYTGGTLTRTSVWVEALLRYVALLEGKLEEVAK